MNALSMHGTAPAKGSTQREVLEPALTGARQMLSCSRPAHSLAVHLCKPRAQCRKGSAENFRIVHLGALLPQTFTSIGSQDGTTWLGGHCIGRPLN